MVGEVLIDQVIIIAPQLITPAILGVDFFVNTRAIIDFPEKCAIFEIENERTKQPFHATQETAINSKASETREQNSWDVLQVTADTRDTTIQAVPIVEQKGTDTTETPSGQNKGTVDGIIPQAKSEKVSYCLHTSNGNRYDSDDAEIVASDKRVITDEELKKKIGRYKDLSEDQRNRLIEILKQYQTHLTKRPGRYTGFEYQFKIEGKEPKSSNSRTIPFALRDEVRTQIETMIGDGILEESYSDYVNPLTLVHRENKPVRICVDARSVNKQMTPDRVKVAPMGELLRFHGSRYITTLDLSAAFHQVTLAKSSRKWTAFNFKNKVYQFARIPYGYKNSLSAFVRALQKVLGDEKNVIMYVDDIVLHSSEFIDHLATLDSVLSKLTSAGFTINASKCHFCRREIKFLGYIISDRTLRPTLKELKPSFPIPPQEIRNSSENS
jgi:hypothetical protein